MINIPKTHTIKEYKYNLKVIKILHLIINFSYVGIIGTFIWAVQKNANAQYGIVGILFIGIIDYFGYLIILNEKKLNDQLEKKIEDSWGVGAVAEMMVEDDLGNLPQDHRIISDFKKRKGGNIDFIIICRKGIFIIEVKANGGLINYFENKLYSYKKPLRDDGGIHQTVINAVYLSNLIEVKFKKYYFVRGILEYPRGQIDLRTIHQVIDNIWIGGERFHEYVLSRSKSNLTQEEVDSIFNYLTSENTQAKEVQK
jgi:hypothetical protein